MKVLMERIYEAFRPYRLGATIDGCEHCVSAKMSAELMRTPLRELTACQLSTYSLKAMTTWGTERDFKHFLPRLLELTASDPREMDWLETLFGKLPLAKFGEWPAQERQLIVEYLHELWRSTLAQPRAHDGDEVADSVLCAIGRTGVEIRPFLDAWLRDESPTATAHLGEFVMTNSNSMQKSPPRLTNSFWETDSPSHAAVVEWLKSTEVKERIRRQADVFGEDLADVLWTIDLY